MDILFEKIKLARDFGLKEIMINSGTLSKHLDCLPEELFELKKIEYLEISPITKSNIIKIQPLISDLKNLREIILKNHSIEVIPEEIENLHNIIRLNFSSNYLTSIPELKLLRNTLEMLSLSDNYITIFPINILKFKKLEELNLSSNEIVDIPIGIKEISSLKVLDLSENQITNLPKEIVELPNLQEIHLRENPLVSPPIEIAEQGIHAIKNYFKDLEKGGVTNYEAKLIFVGNGRSGKTSISKRLLSQKFNINEKVTHGIRIEEMKIPISENTILKANIWDFGGQEIYHSTHRFFLNTRALFILVWDKFTNQSAISNKNYEENFTIDYWLEKIYELSNASPIIMAQNKIDIEYQEIENRSELRENYNVKAFCDLSAKKSENINLLYQQIIKQFKNARELKDIVGFLIPTSWMKVKIRLELLAEEKEYVHFDEYLEICEENGLDKVSSTNLSHNLLHQIGSILHFSSPKSLKNIIILNPKWAIGAVYELLRSEVAINNFGHITEQEIEEIWDFYSYGEQEILIELMKKFELCFELTKNKYSYVIPQLLPTIPPNFSWDYEENIFFAFQYRFLHRGIFTRVIVKLSPLVYENYFWRNGVVLEWASTQAFMFRDLARKRIYIFIRGKNEKELLNKIIEEVSDVDKFATQRQLVGCQCSEYKIDFQQKKYFSYDYLLKCRSEGLKEILCEKCHNKVKVKPLLEYSQSKLKEINAIIPSKKSQTKIREIIKDHIKQGQTKEAIDVLIEITEKMKIYPYNNDCILISSKLNEIKRQNRNDLITFEVYLMHLAKINNSLLEIVYEIENSEK